MYFLLPVKEERPNSKSLPSLPPFGCSSSASFFEKKSHTSNQKKKKERKKEEFPSNPFLLLLLLAIDEMDSQQGDIRRPRVALLYDERMCKHWNPNDDDHPETPDRIRAIWKLLESRGIPRRSPLLLLVIFSREISYRGLVWMRRTRGGENIL